MRFEGASGISVRLMVVNEAGGCWACLEGAGLGQEDVCAVGDEDSEGKECDGGDEGDKTNGTRLCFGR